MNSPAYGADPNSPNTTYVQTDPINFRAVVQKLTGAPEDPSAQKLPLTLSARYANPKPAATAEMRPRRPAFNLHERRHTTKKLELNLNTASTGPGQGPASSCGPHGWTTTGWSFGSHLEMAMVSPVSTLDFLARGSPRTPLPPCEEEDRAIAEKGYYLHPSPLSTPRGCDPPELLPLFPLHSPRDSQNFSES